MNRKVWQLAEPAPLDYITQLEAENIHPVLAQVLYQRRYITPTAALEFLKTHPDLNDNPFQLKDMDKAIYRIRMAIRRGEPIAVYGDFDCDGVTASVLLTQVLAKVGADVRPYIPDRVDEGYGLNSPALKSLADDGVKLVITVDCGIRSVQEVADANSYGVDMIITDHHSVGPQLPEAYAVINPKQTDCNYPERMLAGVGLAYKIAQGLYMEAVRRNPKLAADWHPDEWLDLVAIGTVADIAPLWGENRYMVQRGLKLLNEPERPGLRALYGAAGIKPGEVSAMTIGFGIGPRINAAGRLRSAMIAFNLLDAEDEERVRPVAYQLNDINRERQDKTREMQEWAEESMPDDPGSFPLLFASDKRFEQGVVGLVASRLTESYYRPSVVVQLGEEESHASCRSIPEFHITSALEECDDLLERYGGHAAAAGFTVLNEKIPLLRDRLIEIAGERLEGEELVPELTIDAELSFEQVSMVLANNLTDLEPTGEQNPAPIFMTRNAIIRESKAVGQEGQHLKLAFTDGIRTVEAIAFRWGDEEHELPDYVDVAYRLEVNEWNGQRRLQFNVQDMRPAEGQ